MRNSIKIIIGILFLTSTLVHAQKNKNQAYLKVKALKIKFISEELDLSSEESDKFWALYDDYEKQNRLIRSLELKAIRKKIDSAGDISNLTNEKASQLALKYLNIDVKRTKNKKEFFKKLESIISSKKILKLHLAEIKFNQTLLKKIRKSKH